MKYIEARVALGSEREESELLTFLPDDIRSKRSLDAVCDFLATHVTSENGWAFYAAGTPDVLDRLTLKKKMETEIDISLRRLDETVDPRSEQSRRRESSIPSYRRMSRKATQRTTRILKALQVLMLDPSSANNELKHTCAEFKRQFPRLGLALNWNPKENEKEYSLVQGMLFRSYSSDLAWSLAWPLIIIRAAAWSQTGWDQPYLWESHSALEAKQEHHHSLLSPIEMKIMGYLVRFQSAPGQFCRKTGDDRFLTKSVELASTVAHDFNEIGTDVQDEEVFRQDLLVALGILAHAQAFRSSDNPDTKLFQSFWEQIPYFCDATPASVFINDKASSPRGGRRYTWHYTGKLQKEIGANQLETFLVLAERSVDEASGIREGVVSFSLGRDSYDSELLHGKLRGKIENVIAEKTVPEQMRRFNELFLWTHAPVPEFFSPDTYELCVIVRPKDHIIAKEMIFTCAGGSPSLEIVDAHQEAMDRTLATPINGTDGDQEQAAWRLYEYLFGFAVRHNYIKWVQGAPDNYCPTYLIGRFLDVVFRLRPESCLAIPLSIDGRGSAPIRLPKIPLDGILPDSPAVKAIARYVCARICNKVMAKPVHQLQQGLKNLDRLLHGKFWSDVIRKEFSQNCFAKLLGKYVDNYYSIVQHVQFDQELLPMGRFLSGEDPNIVPELKSLVNARGEVVVLSIDVGATSSKMRLLQIGIDSDDKISVLPWDKHPEQFRVLTALKRLNDASGDNRRRYKNAAIFCERLLDEVSQQLRPHGLTLPAIHAVGMSWPGPVQHGLIRGWSKILENFDSQLHRKNGPDDQHVTDDLHDMVRLDIRSAMEDALRRRTGATARAILVNDGMAHAAGELLRFALLMQPVASGTTIILKSGTGTAGAVVVDGKLVDGLMEFGKLLVNLAYSPQGDYPQGLANLYCSARTLPMLMSFELPHLGKVTPSLSSLEIGLLSNLDDSEVDEKMVAGNDGKLCYERKAFHEALLCLVYECGIIAVAKDLPDEIDTAELGELLNRENWSHRADTRRIIQESLNLVGDKAFDKLRELVRMRGAIRLEAILQLDDVTGQSEIQQLINFIDSPAAPLSYGLRSKIAKLRHAATHCIERLGEFLGDLAALLYEEYRMERLITGGGVLNDRTGEVAIESAIKRLGDYSAIGTATSSGRGFDFSSEIERHNQPAQIVPLKDGIDSAMFGVVSEAAYTLLRQLRQDGLSKIYSLVQEMKLSDTLIVEDSSDEVTTTCVEVRRLEATLANSVQLKEYALSADMVRAYLNENAHDLGIIPAAAAEGKKRKQYPYTRWPIG